MSTAVGTTSPQTYARAGGLLYVFITVGALFAEAFVRGRLVVRGDAAATAANILGSETLFRVGLASEVLVLVADVTVALILYALLEPVNRHLALLAAFLRLTYASVNGAFRLLHLGGAVVLSGDEFLKSFAPEQLHTLSLLSMRLQGLGYGISLIFFGFHCAVLGYLVYRSGYLPRVIGILLMIAGAAYLVNSFGFIVAPAFARTLYPWILLPAAPAEWGLALWLLIKGVDLRRWRAAVSPGSGAQA
jgi:hypothetical protein